MWGSSRLLAKHFKLWPTHDLVWTPPLPFLSAVTTRHLLSFPSYAFMMSAEKQRQKTAIELADEELLANLGYKQEFQRAFTGLEVNINHSIISYRSPE